MKKLLILSTILVSAWSAVAQPWQQPEIVSKADRSTVEFVVRDAKPSDGDTEFHVDGGRGGDK